MDWRARAVVAASLVAVLAPGGRLHAAARGEAAAAAPPTIHDEEGAIAGRVVGPSGAGLPGVTITVNGPPPVLLRSTTTGSQGTYHFRDLPSGSYTVTFVLDGLATRQRRDIFVAAGVCARVDTSLSPEPARDAAAVAIRSAVNRFTGSADVHVVDQQLQWDNLSPGLKAQGAGLGSPVHRITEGQFEAGGPIRRDRAWLWASAGRTVEDVGLIGFYVPACLGPDLLPMAGAADRAECLRADITTTTTVNLDLQYRWTPAHRSTVAWGRSDRRKPTRGASAYTRPEATTRQSSLSMAQPLQVRHQWVVSGRSVIDGRFTFRDTGYILDLQDPSLRDVQAAYDRYTLVRSRSATESECRRPAWDAAVTGTRRFDRWLGGSHDVEVGLKAGRSTDRRRDHTGGGGVAVVDSRSGSALPYQARIVRDGLTDLGAQAFSVFVQDTYSRERVTVAAGLRFDRHDDEAHAATIPADPVLPDLLPAVHFAGADSGVVYNDLSPRLGVAWDLDGSGRTVVGADVARQVGDGNRSSAPLQPTGQTRLVYWWNDADGDGLVDRDELDFSRGLAATPSSNYDAADPGSVRSPAMVEPGLRNTVTDQLSLRLERELARRLTLRVTYVARKTHRIQRTFPVNDDGSLVASDTFVPVAWTPTSCPVGAECPSVTYYERGEPLPSRTILRNDGEYGWRHAVSLVLHKRMARGWMLDASARWERAAWYWPRPTLDYTDPTNIAVSSGAEDRALGSHWTVEVAGTARLPWSLTASGLLTARQGRPYERGVTTPNRGALGSTVADLKPYGSERYPAVGRVDLRLERRITAGRLEFVPAVNVFNLFNSAAVLARNRVQNTSSANNVTKVLAPRSLRLDLEVGW